jgi:hypothetical protein
MTPTGRRRLAAILGMLGSEFDGERAAAGLQAEAFRKRHGLTWEQMLATPPPEAVRQEPEPPPPPQAPPTPDPYAHAPPPPVSPFAAHERRWADPAWRRHNAYERGKGFALAAGALGVGLAAVMHVF